MVQSVSGDATDTFMGEDAEGVLLSLYDKFNDSSDSQRSKKRQSNNSSRGLQCLLLGPPKSGKTSLGMDMAQSLACRSCARLVEAHNNSEDVENSGISIESGSRQVFVIMIVHERKSSNGFPLPCRRIHQRCRAKDELWNECALSHIEVQHLSSFSQLMTFLCSLQTRGKEVLRFLSGVILDDLDVFLETPNDATNAVCNPSFANAMLRFTQLLAVLKDTAGFVEHSFMKESGRLKKKPSRSQYPKPSTSLSILLISQENIFDQSNVSHDSRHIKNPEKKTSSNMSDRDKYLIGRWMPIVASISPPVAAHYQFHDGQPSFKDSRSSLHNSNFQAQMNDWIVMMQDWSASGTCRTISSNQGHPTKNSALPKTNPSVHMWFEDGALDEFDADEKGNDAGSFGVDMTHLTWSFLL